MVVNYGSRLMSVPGRTFWKMSGSGNDFIFFDVRNDPPGVLETPEAIDTLCARKTGIGADGIVFLERDPTHAFGIRYFNRDGTLAELCGNASLCSVTLARALGVIGEGTDFTFRTSSGSLKGRTINGLPEVEMPTVSEQQVVADIPLDPGELRMGFARVGVPHLVVLVTDVAKVDVEARGRQLRHWPTLRDGANANFVAVRDDGWMIRTYERGVEAETLACGTGAVATCSLLGAWGLVPYQVTLTTQSSSPLVATVSQCTEQNSTLRGEGRLVFSGKIADI